MYRVEIERTDTGYSAYSPDVPGVGVAAETREDVERLLHEAIAFHLERDDRINHDLDWRGTITGFSTRGATISTFGIRMKRHRLCIASTLEV
jgi:predicted RNase H-like HicB family nuclease